MIRVARLASGVVTAVNSVLAFPVSYLGALTVISVAARDRKRDPRPVGAPSTRFAVLVPAHDEETTIAVMLTSITGQLYPSSLFGVHVVADNCRDATARVAAEFDIAVHERFAQDDRGKGPALNWLLARLYESGEPFDVAVFVDADTTVDPGFLSALDRRFRDGALAVQGNYSVREAFGSAPAALRYCALACRHHLRPLGRTAIGGSCGLFGNGMAFRSDILKGRQWSAHLVEDLAFQVELLLGGVVVGYEPEAKVAAEMPHTLAGSVTQHQRWELGRLQVLRRYTPPLVRRLVDPQGLNRVAVADTLADIAMPPLSLLAAATSLSAGGAAILAVVQPNRLRRTNVIVATSFVIIIIAHVATALRLARAPLAAYRALLHAPRLVAWKVMILVRAQRRTVSDEWIRTRRNTEELHG